MVATHQRWQVLKQNRDFCPNPLVALHPFTCNNYKAPLLVALSLLSQIQNFLLPLSCSTLHIRDVIVVTAILFRHLPHANHKKGSIIVYGITVI